MVFGPQRMRRTVVTAQALAVWFRMAVSQVIKVQSYGASVVVVMSFYIALSMEDPHPLKQENMIFNKLLLCRHTN